MNNLHALVFSFLLKSGYSRASVVCNFDLLGASAQVGSQLKAPTFVIVDPDTADPLAVIEVVDAVDFEELKDIAVKTGAYASRLAGKTIQGFVIKVDARGRSQSDKVRFFRIWPNSTLYQLSSKTFPDLESLRVARKLILNSASKTLDNLPPIGGSLSEMGDDDAAEVAPDVDTASLRTNAGLYIPAVCILFLVLFDVFYSSFTGSSLLNISQSILLLGGAALLTASAAFRSLSH